MSEEQGGGVSREDIHVKTTDDGQPVLDINGAQIVLRTHLGGQPADETEVDSHGEGAYWLIPFADDMDQWVEISPEYIPADGEHDE